MNNTARMMACKLLCGFGLLLGSIGLAAAAPTISFGTPPWPGLTVKTEITEQLLQALGYQTETRKLGVPFVYRDLASGRLDVFMGGWMPTESEQFDPLEKQGKIVKLRSNLETSDYGLAVPSYVWKNGVHTVKDLTAHADEFDGQVYGIESGSSINQKISAAIKADYEGMGAFRLVASSTSVMLTQVQRSIKREKPVVFVGWRPHWMNIELDMRYLKDKPGSQIAGINSRVLTIATADLPEKQPNVAALLKNIHVDTKTQSRWIYRYSYKNVDQKKVARDWLAAHPKPVATWLQGVKTVDGKSAMDAYRQAFGAAQ